MQTRRSIAMMNALSGEQEAILNGFRNLPAHAGVLSANYQKAAEVENARKRGEHAEELAHLHREMNTLIAEQLAHFHRETNSLIAVKIDNFANEIKSLHKNDDDTRHVLIRIEQDILMLKTPKKPFPWGEFLAAGIVLLSVGVMYLYNPTQKLMIGH
jgi:hypothetical protein